MTRVPLLFAVAAVFAAKVNSFPSSDVAFPEEINEVQTPSSAHDRFHHGYRPEHQNNERYPHPSHRRPDYYRPPGSRPATNYIPPGSIPTRGSRPPFSTPGGNSLGSRPNENSRPEYSEGPALDSMPSFSRPGGNALGSRPNTNSRPEYSERPALGSTPSFSRPGEDIRPQGSRPFGNPRPQRPNQEFSSFSRPEGDFRPPSSRPNVGFQTQDSDGSIPSGSTPGESTIPQYSRPGENPRTDEALGSRPRELSKGDVMSQSSRPDDYSRPDGTNLETPPDFKPEFIAFGSSGASESPDPSEKSSFRPEQTWNPPDSLAGPTTSDTTETTTKIPRRDPTNRIVYTVTCPCAHTFHYKPVCGTDGQTYGNIGVLQCAQTCGSAVKLFLEGSCGRNNGHAGAISLKY